MDLEKIIYLEVVIHFICLWTSHEIKEPELQKSSQENKVLRKHIVTVSFRNQQCPFVENVILLKLPTVHGESFMKLVVRRPRICAWVLEISSVRELSVRSSWMPVLVVPQVRCLRQTCRKGNGLYSRLYCSKYFTWDKYMQNLLLWILAWFKSSLINWHAWIYLSSPHVQGPVSG